MHIISGNKHFFADNHFYFYLKFIQEQIIEILQKGSAQPHVYPDDIKVLLIPNVSSKIQCRVVNECNIVNERFNTIRMSVDSYKKELAHIFEKYEIVLPNDEE